MVNRVRDNPRGPPGATPWVLMYVQNGERLKLNRKVSALKEMKHVRWSNRSLPSVVTDILSAGAALVQNERHETQLMTAFKWQNRNATVMKFGENSDSVAGGSAIVRREAPTW